jgi:hypothetical protein
VDARAADARARDRRPRRAIGGGWAAALAATAEILVDDPGASILIAPGASAIPSAASFREELAYAYLLCELDRDRAVWLTPELFVISARSLFTMLAELMPRVAQIATCRATLS